MSASCGDTAVADLISEQSECYASPPTAVIPVLNHDSCAQKCPSVGRALNAGDYTRRCVGWFWNVWRQQNSLVAWVQQQQYAVVSPQWTDEISGRQQSMRELRLTGRPPQRGSVKNGLCTLHLYCLT